MIFPYKLIDLSHTLDSDIPTWNGGCEFNHDVHIDYSDLLGVDKIIIENVANLDSMPPTGSFFMLLPIKIKDGTEAPVRLVGLIERE